MHCIIILRVKMAVTVGVEPTTYSSGNCRSIQLSYVTKKVLPEPKENHKKKGFVTPPPLSPVQLDPRFL